MFGFGKKNIAQKELLAEIEVNVAMCIKILVTLENDFIYRHNNNLSNLLGLIPDSIVYPGRFVSWFYATKPYKNSMYMGYIVGFLEGMMQSKKYEKDLISDVYISFSRGLSSIKKNHYAARQVPLAEMAWEKAFAEFIDGKSNGNEDGINSMVKGASDGKKVFDALNVTMNDFSKLTGDTFSKLNVSNELQDFVDVTYINFSNTLADVANLEEIKSIHREEEGI